LHKLLEHLVVFLTEYLIKMNINNSAKNIN